MFTRLLTPPIPGIEVLKYERHFDSRGFFAETFRESHLRDFGIYDRFIQDNHSGSIRNVIRGLHFQLDPPMGKLMRVTRGMAFLVAVDIRPGSTTFGKHYAQTCYASDGIQIWAEAGFARGFCTLEDYTEVQYKCTAYHNPRGEYAIRWNDPDLGIEWPITAEEAIVSEKDRNAPRLLEWAHI